MNLTSQSKFAAVFFYPGICHLMRDQGPQRCGEPLLPIQQVISLSALSYFNFNGTNHKIQTMLHFAEWRPQATALCRVQKSPPKFLSMVGSAAGTVASVKIQTFMTNRFLTPNTSDKKKNLFLKLLLSFLFQILHFFPWTSSCFKTGQK